MLAEYVQRFEPKVVGAAQHQELWVPAEKLPEFNANLVSRIRVSRVFYGAAYQGPAPLPLMVRARHPAEQLKVLTAVLASSRFDFSCEVSANWKLILANFAFWAATPAERLGVTSQELSRTLGAIGQVWRHTDLPLPAGELVA
jgi:hypothetical protein